MWTYEAEIVHELARGLPPQRSGDPMLDLAIFRVTRRLDGAPMGSFKAIEFADSDAVCEGEPVWILGYGQQQSNLTNTRNTIKGIVSGRHTDAKGGNFIRTDAEMLGGHSGGPVVNRSGQVIGWSDLSDRERVETKGNLFGSVSVEGTQHEVVVGGTLHGWFASGGIHAMKPINDARPELTAAGVSV